MNYQKISFVAGGGKTTSACNYLSKYSGGLYLAFNKKIVSELDSYGFLSRTFDSFFQRYVIPKCIELLPIISKKSTIKYADERTQELHKYLKSISSLSVDANGNIFYKGVITGATLRDTNYLIKTKKDAGEKYYKTIYNAFGYSCTWITDELRKGIMIFLLNKHVDLVINLIKKRFNYVIIDEAQDMKNHIELFTKALIDNNVKVVLYGDENQNINQGGHYFESLYTTETQTLSYRCSEGVCSWIRNELNIPIIGQDKPGCYKQVDLAEIEKYDNGNRTLLYQKIAPYNEKILRNWSGETYTIQESKGMTIDGEIVVLGKTLSKKFLYTAITRGTSNVYSTIESINEY